MYVKVVIQARRKQFKSGGGGGGGARANLIHPKNFLTSKNKFEEGRENATFEIPNSYFGG
jgi:hypothetical protein